MSTTTEEKKVIAEEPKKVEEPKKEETVAVATVPAAAAAAEGGAAEAEDDKAALADAEKEAEVHFEPLVKLQEVAVVTNEEDEDPIFKMRSKLFRFDKPNNEWKERGLGDVRLMKHKKTGRTRILMRREKTLKVCLNHVVSSQMVLQENMGSDRAWMWTCPMDYAEEPPTEEIFAIRFGSSENAKAFREAFEKAQKDNDALAK